VLQPNAIGLKPIVQRDQHPLINVRFVAHYGLMTSRHVRFVLPKPEKKTSARRLDDALRSALPKKMDKLGRLPTEGQKNV
jgi:hypothetical protein